MGNTKRKPDAAPTSENVNTVLNTLIHTIGG